MDDNQFEAMFSGVIGQEYQFLKLISPFSTEMSRQVGIAVGAFAAQNDQPLNVLELGGGTGITTLSILAADDRLQILSVDSEPVMQQQAVQSLADWVSAGRLQFSGDDALTALQRIANNSMDVVASAYTLHNFEANYRLRTLAEIFRVLKPGGMLINGDRYALDDIDAHTRMTQKEVAGYFNVLVKLNRLDLLEHWIIHLFSDESENHVMREQVAIQQLQTIGYQNIHLTGREQVNALLTAVKPSV